jgi:hypothetical protein
VGTGTPRGCEHRLWYARCACALCGELGVPLLALCSFACPVTSCVLCVCPSSFRSRHRRRRDCVRVSALKNKLNQTTFINSSTYPDDMIYLVDKARDVLHFITGVTGQATRSEVDNIDGDALAHSSNPSTRTIGGCTPQRTRPPAEPRPSQPSSTATRCAQTARDSTFKILRPAWQRPAPASSYLLLENDCRHIRRHTPRYTRQLSGAPAHWPGPSAHL